MIDQLTVIMAFDQLAIGLRTFDLHKDRLTQLQSWHSVNSHLALGHLTNTMIDRLSSDPGI